DAGSPMQCSFQPFENGGGNYQWPRNRVTGGAPDTACASGITFADPKLGPLQNNGGPTRTSQPASNSPLRLAGRNCPSVDQRGNARPNSLCTSGAVEIN
ncbi:MAG TPA: choice-of-anchor Q domain-containing protein, partial [Myxococcaceae bacterium]|nr:choice-of-anchor Q domain-containing protein [Myxococcaceae bacterium]